MTIKIVTAMNSAPMLPCDRDQKNEDSNFSCLCFCRLLVYSTTFIFTLYHPQDDRTVMFNKITEIIDNTLTESPSARFPIFGDFTIHHKEWLIHSNKNDEEGRYCWDFSVASNWQLIEEHTHVPYATGHQANMLDIFLTSWPAKCFSFDLVQKAQWQEN